MKKINKQLILILALILTLLLSNLVPQPRPVAAAGEVVGVWVTTADQSRLLQRQADVVFAPDSGSNPVTIDVNEATTFQQIDGFGASLTDSSAWLLWNRLTAAQRTSVLNSLFNPTTGLGLNFLRQPMGASDFSAVGNYSYDDMPAGQTDPNLNNFNINHDLQYIIPILKEIRSINPALKLMANPWSPPGWMKTSGSMIGGNLRPEFRTAWANYFVRFVQAYTAQGLPIEFISMQNEPLFIPPGYPGMGISASEQATLLANFMGPAFAQAGIQSKILVWDHNWTNQYPFDVLNNATARSFAAGTAYHWYGGTVTSQTDLHNAFPDKGIWFSEGSGFTGTSFAQNLRDVDQLLIIANMRNWGKATVRWNLVLDQTFGPKNGGCQNCTATITVTNPGGVVTLNADYYALGHASKFVVPGAFRIASNNFPGSIENVAFRNPDGSKVVIAFNAGANTSTFKIRWAGQSFSYSLPGGAVATFKWTNATGNPTPTNTPIGPTPTRTPTQVAGTNLALNKPATSSSNETAAFPPNLAVDGNTGTRWSSAFSDPQWIRVDLGTTTTINRVVLRWEAAFGRAYQIQTSNDGVTWTNIFTTTTGDGGVDDLAVSGSGRFIRMNGTTRATAFGYSLFEFEVYGSGGGPTSTPTPTPTTGRDAYTTTQAESFNAQSGTQTETTTDTGGGQNVGFIANGDWLQYNGVNFGATSPATVQARIASGAAAGVTGTVQFRLDSLTGPVITSIAISPTGGWQLWTTSSVNVTGATGTHNVFVVFSSGQAADFVNVNWFIFNH